VNLNDAERGSFGRMALKNIEKKKRGPAITCFDKDKLVYPSFSYSTLNWKTP